MANLYLRMDDDEFEEKFASNECSQDICCESYEKDLLEEACRARKMEQVLLDEKEVWREHMFHCHETKTPPLKVISINQTCSACPSQWDAVLEDGREVYIRYRWGRLSIRCPGVDGEEIFGAVLADDLDGCLEYSELKEHAKEVLDLPVECSHNAGPMYLINFKTGTTETIELEKDEKL